MTTLRAAIGAIKEHRIKPKRLSRMVLSEREGVEGRCVLSFAVYFLYILRTSSNGLYVGVTEDLDQRLGTHNSGKGAEWTKADKNARIAYSESHPTLGSARKREIQLKKWSRAKKEALIAGDLTMLQSLSRCKSLKSRRVAKS